MKPLCVLCDIYTTVIRGIPVVVLLLIFYFVILRSADGIVTEVYAHPMMGTTVVIRHDGDAESVYQNLAEDVAVSVGDTVKSGEVLGAVGESALIEIAEEPHLHFALRVAGKSVNPLDYISAATMTIVYDE